MMDPENKLRYKDSKKEILKFVKKIKQYAKDKKNYPAQFLCSQIKEVLEAPKTKSFQFSVKEIKNVTDIFTNSDLNFIEIGQELHLLKNSIDWNITAINEHYSVWEKQALHACKDLIHFYESKVLRIALVVVYYQTLNEKIYYQDLLTK